MTKEKFQMQVNKWDMFRIFNYLTQVQVKKLMQLIADQNDPQSINIHQLMVALILPQQNDNTTNKVTRVFEIISFELEEGKLSATEVQYIYHLVNVHIQATTSRLQEIPSQFEKTALKKFFGAEDLKHFEVDEVETVDLIDYLACHPTISQLFGILSAKVVTPRDEHSRLKYDSAFERGSEFDEYDSESHQQSQNKQSPVRQEEEKEDHVSFNPLIDSHNQNENNTVQDSMERKQTNGVMSVEDNSGDEQGKEEKLREETVVSLDIELSRQISLLYAQDSSKEIKDFKTYERMCSKLGELHQDVFNQTDDETAVMLNTVSSQFKMLKDVHQDFFGQKFFTKKMLDLFYKQPNEQSIESIVQYDFQEKMQQEKQQNPDFESSDDKQYDPCLLRSRVAQTFRNFYANRHAELKYEVKMQQPKLIQYFGKRGERRLLEKKKFKNLGELQVLCETLHNVQVRQQRKEGIHKSIMKVKMNTIKKEMTMKFLKQCLHQTETEQDETASKINMINMQKGLGEHFNLAFNQSDAISDLKSTRILPSQEEIFKKVKEEFSNLRQCKMSKRDLVKYIQLKEVKSESNQILHFWEGVNQCLQSGNDHKSFQELAYFQNFTKFAEKSQMKQKVKYFKDLRAQQNAKENLLLFSTQIGKLKGFNTLIGILAAEGGKSNQTSEEEVKKYKKFEIASHARIKVLLTRLEKIDSNLASLVTKKVSKKRSFRLYFTALGQIATYKCIVKSFDFTIVINYLCMSLCKIRIWQNICLTCQHDCYNREKVDNNQVKTNVNQALAGHFLKASGTSSNSTGRSKAFAQPVISPASALLAATFKMDRLCKLLTLCSELRRNRKDEASIKFERFVDQLAYDCEEERLMCEAPSVPLVEPLESYEINKNMNDTVTAILMQMYQRLIKKKKLQNTMIQKFCEFSSANLSLATYDLTGSLTFQQFDIENSGQVLFDFTDLEDLSVQDRAATTPGFGYDFCEWLSSLSQSLGQTYYNSAVDRLKRNLSEGHAQCRDFLQGIQQKANLENYDEVMKVNRASTLSHFIEQLLAANRGYLVNHMDMLTLSMPLEYSLVNNYWTVHGMQLYLNHLERDIKYTQLIHAQSPILLSKRQCFLNRKIAQQLILAAFNLAPESIHSSQLSNLNSMRTDDDCQREGFPESMTDDQTNTPLKETKELPKGKYTDRSDFYAQWRLIKAEDELEKKVKWKIFRDLYDSLILIQKQLAIEKQSCVNLLKEREDVRMNTPRSANKDNTPVSKTSGLTPMSLEDESVLMGSDDVQVQSTPELLVQLRSELNEMIRVRDKVPLIRKVVEAVGKKRGRKVSKHVSDLAKSRPEDALKELQNKKIFQEDQEKIINGLLKNQVNTDLGRLISIYSNVRQTYFERLKVENVANMFKGALNFTKHLFKQQEGKNEYGSNLTMRRLRDYLTNIHDKNLILHVSSEEQSVKINMLQVMLIEQDYYTLVEPILKQVKTPQQKKEKLERQQEIDLQKEKESKSAFGQKKVSTPKGEITIPKPKKKKKQKSAIQLVEHNIIEYFCKTHYHLDLIQLCSDIPDIEEFYTEVSTQIDKKQKVIQKISPVLTFLKQNTRPMVTVLGLPTEIMENNQSLGSGNIGTDEMLKMAHEQAEENEREKEKTRDSYPSYAELKGAKLFWSVQSETEINQSYVYNPREKVDPCLGKYDKNNKGFDFGIDDIVKSERSSREFWNENQDQGKKHSSQHFNEEGEVTTKKITLNAQQVAGNVLFGFLLQLAVKDETIQAKTMLENDKLQDFLQIMSVQLAEKKNYQQERKIVLHGLKEDTNIIHLQYMPLTILERNYNKSTKFIMRDLLETIQKKDKYNLHFDLMTIANKREALSLLKGMQGILDKYLSLPDLEEVDQLDFNIAITNTKRQMDQQMRTYKEHIDLEANKQHSVQHNETVKLQETRMMQEVAALQLINLAYYLKQEQHRMQTKSCSQANCGQNLSLSSWTPLMYEPEKEKPKNVTRRRSSHRQSKQQK